MSADAVSLPLVFLAGVASFASPCFLPIVPVFAAYLSGSAPAERYAKLAVGSGNGFISPPERAASTKRTDTKTQGSAGRVRVALNATVFVMAFSAVFIGLWLAVAAVGWVVGDYREVLRIIGGSLLILMGLVMSGWLQLDWMSRRVPSGLVPAPGSEVTLGRSVLMGLGFGAGWSPCIGPVLGVVLGVALTGGSILKGGALLALYCLGLGLPFVLVALGLSQITAKLSWFSRHYATVQTVAGVLLIGLGALIVTDLLAPLSGFTWLTV